MPSPAKSTLRTFKELIFIRFKSIESNKHDPFSLDQLQYFEIAI
jgi:hypothetical protein